MTDPWPLEKRHCEALLGSCGTPKVMAYHLGCHVATVYKLLLKLGIRWKIDWDAELAKGGTVIDIAARTNCARITVYNNARKRGIKLAPLARPRRPSALFLPTHEFGPRNLDIGNRCSAGEARAVVQARGRYSPRIRETAH